MNKKKLLLLFFFLVLSLLKKKMSYLGVCEIEKTVCPFEFEISKNTCSCPFETEKYVSPFKCTDNIPAIIDVFKVGVAGVLKQESDEEDDPNEEKEEVDPNEEEEEKVDPNEEEEEVDPNEEEEEVDPNEEEEEKVDPNEEEEEVDPNEEEEKVDPNEEESDESLEDQLSSEGRNNPKRRIQPRVSLALVNLIDDHRGAIATYKESITYLKKAEGDKKLLDRVLATFRKHIQDEKLHGKALVRIVKGLLPGINLKKRSVDYKFVEPSGSIKDVVLQNIQTEARLMKGSLEILNLLEGNTNVDVKDELKRLWDKEKTHKETLEKLL